MKHATKFFTLLIISFGGIAANGQNKTGYYLGQPLPLNEPVIFAKGIISDGLGNRDMAISPDGNEIFYTLQFNRGRVNVIMQVQRIDGKWEKPRVASFSGVDGDLEPAFSPDGSKLYFTSNRPVTDTGKAKDDFDLWYVTRKNNEWGNPVRLPESINSAKDEFYPSVTKTGNIYFTTELDENKKEDIVVSYYNNVVYAKPVALSDSVNSTNAEFNAFVDPDEQYIIFSSYGRKDNSGGDLYISRKNKNGEWGAAKNLNPPINSPGIDYCPYVSPDGKYFFFTSNRSTLTQPFNKKMEIEELKTALNSAGNGLDDIYWVKLEEVLK